MSEGIQDLIRNAITRDNANWQKRVEETKLIIPGVDTSGGRQNVPFEGGTGERAIAPAYIPPGNPCPMPCPPTSGEYALTSTDGTMAWEAITACP